MRTIVLMLSLLTVLSACTALSPPADNHVVAGHTYQMQIEMSGRMSARYEANNREQSVSVHFTWSQTPEQTLISLYSPTGQTMATILINAMGARLTAADKPPRFASDINQLSTEVLGWPLPVAGLRDWLQGYPDAEHAMQITEAISGQTFIVNGWQLRYLSWQTETHAAATFERPRRLDLSRQTQQAGLVSLRIVIDDWSKQ